jgi:hypothetical protein
MVRADSFEVEVDGLVVVADSLAVVVDSLVVAVDSRVAVVDSLVTVGQQVDSSVVVGSFGVSVLHRGRVLRACVDFVEVVKADDVERQRQHLDGCCQHPLPRENVMSGK